MPCPSPPSVGTEAPLSRIVSGAISSELPRTAELTAPVDRNVAVGSHGHRLQLADALTPR